MEQGYFGGRTGIIERKYRKGVLRKITFQEETADRTKGEKKTLEKTEKIKQTEQYQKKIGDKKYEHVHTKEK